MPTRSNQAGPDPDKNPSEQQSSSIGEPPPTAGELREPEPDPGLPDVAELSTVLMIPAQDLRVDRLTLIEHHRELANEIHVQQVGLRWEIAELEKHVVGIKNDGERDARMHLINEMWQKWSSLDVTRRAHVEAYRRLQKDLDQEQRPGR